MTLRLGSGAKWQGGSVPNPPTVWDGTYDGTANGPMNILTNGGSTYSPRLQSTTSSNVFAVFYQTGQNIYASTITISNRTTTSYANQTTVATPSQTSGLNVNTIADNTYLLTWCEAITSVGGLLRYTDQKAMIVTWTGSSFSSGTTNSITLSGPSSSVTGIDKEYIVSVPTNDAGTQGLFFFTDDNGSTASTSYSFPMAQGWTRSGNTITLQGSAIRFTTNANARSSYADSGMRVPGTDNAILLAPADNNDYMNFYQASFNGTSIDANSGFGGSVVTSDPMAIAYTAGLVKGLTGPNGNIYVAAKHFGDENDASASHGPRLYTATVDTTGSSIAFSNLTEHTDGTSGSGSAATSYNGGISVIDLGGTGKYLMTGARVGIDTAEIHIWEHVSDTDYNRPATISIPASGMGANYSFRLGSSNFNFIRTAENNVLFVFGANNTDNSLDGIGAMVLAMQ